MPEIARMATSKLLGILTGSEGVPAAVAAVSQAENLSLPPVASKQIIAQNVAPDVSERATGETYPLVYVYCSKVVNQLREKFRTFSGEAEMVIEARISQDRLDDIQNNLQSYVGAVTQVLDDNRGTGPTGYSTPADMKSASAASSTADAISCSSPKYLLSCRSARINENAGLSNWRDQTCLIYYRTTIATMLLWSRLMGAQRRLLH